MITHPTRPATSVVDLYEHFLTALSAVIEGTMESAKYEDECRQLMGSGSYQSFTMDKLVIQTVRQLQALVVDPVATKLRVSLPGPFQGRCMPYTHTHSTAQHTRTRTHTHPKSSPCPGWLPYPTPSRSCISTSCGVLSTFVPRCPQLSCRKPWPPWLRRTDLSALALLLPATRTASVWSTSRRLGVTRRCWLSLWWIDPLLGPPQIVYWWVEQPEREGGGL